MFAVHAVLSYLIFLVTFLYAIGFTGNLVVPKSIDSGTSGALLPALIVDLLLLGAFALQHSLMARPAFKRWWTRYVPSPIERSTYVLFASLVLILLFSAWRPLPTPIWDLAAPQARGWLWALFGLGWTIVVLSTFMISHFELFGLKQAMIRWLDPDPPAELTTRYLYRYVRHPIMLGFLIAFWATPTMTQGHLLFAIMTTGYILIGVALEERDLIAAFGDRYLAYRARVPALVPWRSGVRSDLAGAPGAAVTEVDDGRQGPLVGGPGA
jgi:protein-S-isoprenylcysteine O-methyltransferase Ste14